MHDKKVRKTDFTKKYYTRKSNFALSICVEITSVYACAHSKITIDDDYYKISKIMHVQVHKDSLHSLN